MNWMPRLGRFAGLRPVVFWLMVVGAASLFFRPTPFLPVSGLVAGLLPVWLFLPRTTPPRSLKAVFGSALLLSVSVVLSVVVLEVGLRLVTGGHEVAAMEKVCRTRKDCLTEFLPSRRCPYYMSVDAKGTRVSRYYDFSEQGLRDRLIPPKQDGEFRILLLGDSYTIGAGVEVDQTISHHLEQMLNELPMTKRVSVVNCGFGGYGPWQERVMLRERGFPLEPDLVILQLFLGNDIDNTLYKIGKWQRAYDPAWVHRVNALLHDDNWQLQLNRWLYAHSKAYYLVARHFNQRDLLTRLFEQLYFMPPSVPQPRPSENRPHWLEVDLRDWYEELNTGWDMLQTDVLAIRDDCRAHGADFAVYAVPQNIAVSDTKWLECIKNVPQPERYERGKDVRLANEFFERAKLPCIDLAAALLRLPDAGALYFPFDGHFCPQGTEFVAGVLRDYLRDHYFPGKGLLQ